MINIIIKISNGSKRVRDLNGISKKDIGLNITYLFNLQILTMHMIRFIEFSQM